MAPNWGTHHVGVKQAERAFHAVRYASEIGRPLNLMVTVHFTALGIKPEEAGQVFRRLWSRVGRWWAYQRGAKARPLGPFDCVAIHEHPRERGRHAHWVLRAPNGARPDLERTIRSRLEKLTGFACVGRALNFKKVDTPGCVAKYVLKGVDPAYARYFHMEASDQGFIYGRRLAISRSIGAAARAKARWKRTRRPKP
jgi:hypothetical protein